MKESENVSDEGTSRNREDMGKTFLFSPPHLSACRSAVWLMTMPASNNTAARRYLDLLRHVLCRDRFPDARYDMSSGSLKLMSFDLAPSCARQRLAS